MVLAGGGSANQLDLAARERRLEDVGGVECSLGPAGADQGVQLVEEGDDLTGLEFFYYLPQPFFELTAVLGASHHAGQVEGDYPRSLQDRRHPTLDYRLGQALDYGRLTDARVADQYRVVLGAAGEYLNDAVDLVYPADYRVQLTFAGVPGQVTGVFIQKRGLRRFFRRLRRLLAAGDYSPANGVDVFGKMAEDAVGDAVALADDPQQNVLGADRRRTHVARFGAGQLHYPAGARGNGRWLAGAGPLATTHQLFDHAAHGLQVGAVLG